MEEKRTDVGIIVGRFQVADLTAAHIDLIQSVISCANIIDLGFLVIDAKQGIQVQTGEHLIILDLLKIPNIFILINKIDLVN